MAGDQNAGAFQLLFITVIPIIALNPADNVRHQKLAWPRYAWNFFATGIRRDELVKLNIDDIDNNSRLVRVHGKGKKTFGAN